MVDWAGGVGGVSGAAAMAVTAPASISAARLAATSNFICDSSLCARVRERAMTPRSAE